MPGRESPSSTSVMATAGCMPTSTVGASMTLAIAADPGSALLAYFRDAGPVVGEQARGWSLSTRQLDPSCDRGLQDPMRDSLRDGITDADRQAQRSIDSTPAHDEECVSARASRSFRAVDARAIDHIDLPTVAEDNFLLAIIIKVSD